MSNLFKRRKKDDTAVELCSGVRILNQPEIANRKHVGLNAGKKRPDSKGIAAKCGLEVMIIGGAVCGLLSCLDITYGVPFILAVYALFSVYFCSLFRSGKLWIRDIGYVIALIAFILFIMSFRKYVNSGFYAMVNQFFDKVTDYYGADEMRMYTETVSNRALTVPIASVAIGFVAIIIINIFINTSMSVFWAVAMSLPVFILPLFFRLEPDSGYMFMVAAGVLGVVCLRGNGHFRMTDRLETFEYNSKKKRLVYRHSDRASRQLVICVAVVCLLAGSVVMSIRPFSRYYYRLIDSSAKEAIEEPLGNLIMYGLASMRNASNTGGLSNGSLGGVSDVIFDDRTDLVVTFAPYSSDRIYLKSFVGDVYASDHWKKDDNGAYGSPVITDDTSYGKMEITNIDGGSNAFFYPYYTYYEESIGSLFTGLRRNTLTYVPKEDYECESEEPDSVYTEVPDENVETIEKFCREAGIEDGVMYTAQEIIDKVYEKFVADYPYTLHPGATPAGEDYVNYFLETTKKGLCANYASAGVLILRSQGIPARYVEGYVIDYDDILSGEVLSGEDDGDYLYSDYFYGDSKLGETGVIEVSVTDRGAHAWIEAYIDGKWQIVELTPPSDDDEDDDEEDFWTRLAKMLSGDDDEDSGDGDGGSGSGSGLSLDESMRVVYALFACMAVVAAFFVVRVLVIKTVRIAGYHGMSREKNIIAYYRYMCNYMRLADVDFDKAGSHREQLARMCPDADSEELGRIADYMESISYGDAVVKDAQEYRHLRRRLKCMLKGVHRRTPVLKRVDIFRRL